MNVLIFTISLFVSITEIQCKESPVVELPYLGKIEGDIQSSLGGRNFFSFEGVPYARPPVGKHRFREPAPTKPWNHTWVAKTIHKCIQYNQYTNPGGDFVIGEEDCLYLNIYTPTLNPKSRLNVIVYIHGGAFMFNYGGLQGPQYLLDQDVVYVNINYRLGPLGFLSTEDEAILGNNGIRDQILALRWIKENIQHFGGNPFSPFGVVIDSWSSDPVLPDHPYNLIKNKKFAELPWIASHTGSEGLYPGADFYAKDYLKEIDSRWNEIIPHILDYNFTVNPKLRDQVSEGIRRRYLGGSQVNRTTFMDLVKILSDRIFLNDIYKTVKLQAPLSKSPIYFYIFSYRGAHSKSEARSGSSKNFGAAHGDDTSYVFKTAVDTTTTVLDREMVKLFVELFTSFANDGKPEIDGQMWPPLSQNPADALTVLKIESPKKLSLQKVQFDIGEFWGSLPIRENEKLFDEQKDEL